MKENKLMITQCFHWVYSIQRVFYNDKDILSKKCRRESIMKVRKGPDGIHLFDRNTGVNILLDETIPPSSSWSASPRQVSIALTNACDLVCPHCYAPKRKAVLELDGVR